jgi:hypothetical protein
MLQKDHALLRRYLIKFSDELKKKKELHMMISALEKIKRASIPLFQTQRPCALG